MEKRKPNPQKNQNKQQNPTPKPTTTTNKQQKKPQQNTTKVNKTTQQIKTPKTLVFCIILYHLTHRISRLLLKIDHCSPTGHTQTTHLLMERMHGHIEENKIGK